LKELITLAAVTTLSIDGNLSVGKIVKKRNEDWASALLLSERFFKGRFFLL